LLHERAASFAARGLHTQPAGITAAWEADRITSVDAAVAIQWDEADAARALVPGTEVIVAPPIFPLRTTPTGVTPVVNSCLFVGNGTFHNVDGLTWMIDEVWPLIRQSVSGATLRVAGAVSGQVRGGTPGVQMLGEVEDLASEYFKASVVVVPLRAGSGIKVKLVEAICHGRASVVTAVGAQGLGALVPRPFLVADDATEFAAAVAELLGDSNRRSALEVAAVAAARAFDPGTAHAGLIGALLGQ
jgi:hypothetical protein